MPEGNHIGTLVKPHGYKGDLVLSGNADRIRKLIPGIPLFIELSGQRIPFFIEEIEVDQTGAKCILKFEFIDSNDDAGKFVTCQVFSDMHPEKVGEPDLNTSDLIGYRVHDTVTGEEFIVKEVIENDENPVLIIHNEKHELMLPAKADYILDKDHRRGLLTARFPDGLIME
ncbi:MAG: hypothetical protein K9J30_05325 [Bacteroidales bacterium]|nr:hypothetical protein [Bacteroidales bacterium]